MGNQIQVPENLTILPPDYSWLDDRSGKIINTSETLNRVVNDSRRFFKYTAEESQEYVNDMSVFDLDFVGLYDSEVRSAFGWRVPAIIEEGWMILLTYLVASYVQKGKDLDLSEDFEIDPDQEGVVDIDEEFGMMLFDCNPEIPIPQNLVGVDLSYVPDDEYLQRSLMRFRNKQDVREFLEKTIYKLHHTNLKHKSTVDIHATLVEFLEWTNRFVQNITTKANETGLVHPFLQAYIGPHYDDINSYIRDPQSYINEYPHENLAHYFMHDPAHSAYLHKLAYAVEMVQTKVRGFTPDMQMPQIVESIDSLYHVSPKAPANFKVLRCVKSTMLNRWRRDFGLSPCTTWKCIDEFLKFLVGKTIVNKSYLSTGLFPLSSFCDVEGSHTIIMALDVVEGTPYLFPFTSETEVLFPRNTRITFNDIQFREIPFVARNGLRTKPGIVMHGTVSP